MSKTCFISIRTKGQQNITFDQFKAVLLEMGNKRYGAGNGEKIFELVQDKAPKAVGVTVRSCSFRWNNLHFYEISQKHDKINTDKMNDKIMINDKINDKR